MPGSPMPLISNSKRRARLTRRARHLPQDGELSGLSAGYSAVTVARLERPRAAFAAMKLIKKISRMPILSSAFRPVSGCFRHRPCKDMATHSGVL